MDDKKLTIDQIIDANRALDIIASIDTLPGETQYWLGRFGDNLKPHVKAFLKAREPMRKEILNKQIEIMRSKVAGADKEVAALDIEYEEFVEKIKDSINEKIDSVKVPPLQKDSFIAKEEIKRTRLIKRGENETEVEVVIKKGQPLVPLEFFRLMGDLVQG